MKKNFNLYPKLLLSDCRGCYIPRYFAAIYRSHLEKKTEFKVSGLSSEDLKILENPEHDHYWLIWHEALHKVKIKNKHGTEFTLYQEGHLWIGSKSQFKRFFKEGK